MFFPRKIIFGGLKASEGKLYSVYICYISQIDVSFSCVCPVIDHEFRHNIVRQSSCASANYFDNVMTKLIVNNRTDALKTDINLFFYDNKLSNFPLSLADASHEFQRHIVPVRISTKKSQ